ncbi:MAG: hypothetical protein NZ842_17170 [Dehalococcoidia bacterium]|jgi:hypothetical protein|nr:hypothetical protein [Dehalococcoidia bacterium]
MTKKTPPNESALIPEDEWAELQGMTNAELRRGTDFQAFYKDADDRIAKEKDRCQDDGKT